jgi:two-component system, cell cycle response regulator DivK
MDKPNQAPLVLIVDDYAEGREICAEYLAFRGYRVATAEDGIDAIEKTRALLPDVILMDLSLPRLDGWEASRRIRADERTRHIPIIALTAHALSSARTRALDAGCNSVVTKPCPPRDLEAEVRRHLGLGAADSEAAPGGGDDPPPGTTRAL